jgi:hypothetical protein
MINRGTTAAAQRLNNKLSAWTYAWAHRLRPAQGWANCGVTGGGAGQAWEVGAFGGAHAVIVAES